MRRSRSAILCAVFAAAMMAFVTYATSPAYATADFKITICHATGNAGHYNDITVSVSSASGVPDGSEEFYWFAPAQSGHFGANGQPVHFRASWGGEDFWIPDPDATADDCAKAAPPPK